MPTLPALALGAAPWKGSRCLLGAHQWGGGLRLAGVGLWSWTKGADGL